MVPWPHGKVLVWDATCVDTSCDSHRTASAKEGGGAAAHAESEKAKKYAHLDECTSSNRLLEQLEKPSPLPACLLQRLSVAIQIGNMSAALGTLPVTDID